MLCFLFLLLLAFSLLDPSVGDLVELNLANYSAVRDRVLHCDWVALVEPADELGASLFEEQFEDAVGVEEVKEVLTGCLLRCFIRSSMLKLGSLVFT